MRKGRGGQGRVTLQKRDLEKGGGDSFGSEWRLLGSCHLVTYGVIWLQLSNKFVF